MQPTSSTVPVILPKEPVNDTHYVDIPRVKRSRAKRSCDLCRKKKTRCNADVMQPCSTCQSNNMACEFLLDQKKRGPVASSYVEDLESRIKRLEALLQSKPNNNHTNLIAGTASQLADKSRPSRPYCNALIVDNESANNDDALASRLGNLQLTDYDRTLYIGDSAGFHLMDQQLFSTNLRHRVLGTDEPWVVQKVNSEKHEHVIIHGEEYNPADGLRILACQPHPQHRYMLFSDIPEMDVAIADTLIKSYFIHIHPHYPIVNKVSFLEQYYYQHPQPPNMHLLYAMCTLGAQCLIRKKNTTHDRDTLTRIYKALRAKAEQILENVHKRSKLSTVQALLLLTTFTAGESDNLDDMLQHWYVIAQGLGLHRTSRQWQIPHHEIELRRRIWYAAYNLDRQIAAEMGRPIAILDEDFDVQLPSPFELPSSFQTQTPDGSRPDLIVEAETAIVNKTPVYEMFLQSIGLSRLLGHVLVSMYSPKVLNSSTRRRDGYVIDTLHAKLIESRQVIITHVEPMSYSCTQLAFLNISYNCILLLLHRPFIGDDEMMDMTRALQAISQCTSAATSIVDSAKALEKQDDGCMSWSWISYAVFQAALVSIHNAKSDNQSVQQQGIHNLTQCAELHAKENAFSSNQMAGLLKKLATRYAVFNGQHHSNDMIELCPLAATQDSGASTSSSNITPSTTDNGSSPSQNNEQCYSVIHDALLDNGQDTMPPTSLLNNELQFDLASLTSDIPLWNAPSGVTRTDWDPFLQQPSL
ncbi:hypothetical protein K492DRAFT_164679 [Lichtheimia hyalospora FSU 10163]|nr:hypothetical protein K492DRAFT_164679 [Lichtheimia hyalospora FSU 10163]